MGNTVPQAASEPMDVRTFVQNLPKVVLQSTLSNRKYVRHKQRPLA